MPVFQTLKQKMLINLNRGWLLVLEFHVLTKGNY